MSVCVQLFIIGMKVIGYENRLFYIKLVRSESLIRIGSRRFNDYRKYSRNEFDDRLSWNKNHNVEVEYNPSGLEMGGILDNRVHILQIQY